MRKKHRSAEKAEIYRVFGLFLLLVLVAYAGIYLTIIKIPMLAYSSVGAGILIYLSYWLYIWTGNDTLAGNNLLFWGVGIVCVGVYLTDGARSPSIFWLSFVPLVAAFLLGTRGALIWTGIAGALLGIFLALTIADYPFPAPPTGYHLMILEGSAFFGILGAMAILSILFVRSVEAERKNAANKQKKVDNLLRAVSHDIQNPLTVIISHSERLLRHQGDPGILKSAQALDRSATAISSILNLVKKIVLVKEGIIPDLGPVNLEAICHECVSSLQTQLEAKDLKVVIDGTLTNPLVLAEPVSLANQVINNMLTNAIKFSLKGGTILLSLSDSPDQANLRIRDEGIGMPTEMAAQLWSLENRSRLGTMGERGTGLGMSILKEYLEYYRASVSVTSQSIDENPNAHGTEFHITFRRAKNEAPSLSYPPQGNRAKI